MAEITVAICNYNTTVLTNSCIDSYMSYNSHIMSNIVVLDNSDTETFISVNPAIQVLDNTKQTIINFDKVISQFLWNNHLHSNNGSFKHAYSIEYLLNICTTDKLLLLDSDVIVNRTLSFLQSDDIIVSDVQMHLDPIEQPTKNHNKPYLSKSRFLPYIQLINVKKLKENRLHYFDPKRIQGGCSKSADSYDTGASLFEDVSSKNLSWKRIHYSDFITHLGGQSWKHFDKNHICY